jgi:hypothetical protein
MELAPVPRIDAEVNDTIDLVNQMVRQAQSGDAGAFEGVYRTHVGRIHSLCLRMSGDAAGTLQREVSFRRISGRMIVVANERSAGGFADDAVLDEPAVLDQVQAQAARQRAASGVAPEVVPADANARAQAAEPPVETARLSEQRRVSSLSSSAPDANRQDGALRFDDAAPGASAPASLSTTPLLVPGVLVRDVLVAPEADSVAGGPGGLVVVTQELDDGRIIELRFVPLSGSGVLLREAFQERNEIFGRTLPAGWGMAVREVPGGVAVLSGALT